MILLSSEMLEEVNSAECAQVRARAKRERKADFLVD